MNIESQIKQTLEKAVVSKKEKILVALSGGKDSAVVGFVLKKLGYSIEGLYVNLCMGRYSEECLKAIEELCSKFNIKLHVYNLREEEGVSMLQLHKKIKAKQKIGSCAICGVWKKWILNKVSRELKAKKIVTGHNLDDEAQTFLLNVLKGSMNLSANTGVVTKNFKDKKFIPRVKPLYYIPEKEVLKFAKKNKLPFVDGKCPSADLSYRIELRNFLENRDSKEKENIVKIFEGVEKNLKKNSLGKKEINYCSICGEPCRGEICKKCKLLKIK